ncbi:MAG: YebC/PmpR family DNA-binding transcriptional regulator [Patescibacteria group bacterium]|jgi:YebC/PmpR family DNA-binding regulatory protein
MSGHSKWATIKRAKEAKDAKRGNVFTKLGNNITVAARNGGDPEINFSLRIAIDKAKAANMPKDNIERAIKRGTGELGGAQIEELIYEGFGPAKSGFIIEVLTDNKNRSAAEIRHLLTKYGGSLGALNSVSWNFNHLGIIRIIKENLTGDMDELELELIDAGADDIKKEEEGTTILTAIENLQKVKKLLDEKNIKTESAGIEYIVKDEKKISDEEKKRVEQFIEALEENDDVNNYYTDVNL